MLLFPAPQGVPDKKVAHPTVPESPAFTLTKRARVEHNVEEVQCAKPTLFCLIVLILVLHWMRCCLNFSAPLPSVNQGSVCLPLISSRQVKPPSAIRAHPVPHFGLPFQPRLPEKSQVESCPFSFEERERESRVLKEKKLEQMRNEEVGFHFF